MTKIAEGKLSSCGLEVADIRKNCDCGVGVVEQHSFKSCGIAIVEVLPASCGIALVDSKKSCACPPLQKNSEFGIPEGTFSPNNMCIKFLGNLFSKTL
jgi:hypothetical protein